MSPLIDSDSEKELRRQVEGMGSGGGMLGPSEGGGEPSSSARMRIDFGKQPISKPPILRYTETIFDGVTGLLVTSQGKNSTVYGKTFKWREYEKHTMFLPEGVGW